MVIIADSGSTNTIWQVINKKDSRTIRTRGINPFHLNKSEIISLLKEDWPKEEFPISSIYFYGAGCTPEKKEVLFDALSSFFNIVNIEIHSDLTAAAHALCQHQPGIACILGTGSNSCFYDGKNIISQVSPLGYILGDEGSGAVLGKILIGDILKKQLPDEIIEDFFTTYHLHPSEILEQVYRKPLANVYLATFTSFIAKHISHEEMNQLVKKEFVRFFERNIMQYKSAHLYPIHFTGSIAFVFKDIIYSITEEKGLTLGNILQSPMEGLIQYHQGMNI